jgi:hypothetical protein
MCNIIIARIENSTPFFNEIEPYPALGEFGSTGELGRVRSTEWLKYARNGRFRVDPHEVCGLCFYLMGL